MQTAQQHQLYDFSNKPVSLATCIETLYFEQQHNGQVYRTSLNNRLLVVGNSLNTVSKKNIVESLNNAEIPFYYITPIKSDTASGLYRLDVSLYAINNAVRNTAIIKDINKNIEDVCSALDGRIDNVSNMLYHYQLDSSDNFLHTTGGKMSGGIVFKYSDISTDKLPGIGSNGQNLVIACPSDGQISLWGSLSEEYGMNQTGITISYPTTNDNGKVLVYNMSSSQLVWSKYNAGSLQYSEAKYNKYYILGITDESFASREVGEDKFIATEGNIETNVYVHRKNVYANAFYGSSDINLKTDIQHINISTYIPEVVQFKWLDTSQLSYGFIAQELEEHGLSYLMDKDDDDHWRVNYSAVLSLVVGDLQHKVKTHQCEIQDLKSENLQLKNTIFDLEKRLEKIESLLNGSK